jgi:hypothetical protein
MKPFRIIAAFILALIALAFADCARAQNAGLYQAFTGGTIVLPSATTNTAYIYQLTNGVQNGVISTNVWGAPGTSTNLVLNVSEYDYVGFTWSLTGTATSTNDILIYKSFDNGGFWEATPTFSYTQVPGAAAGGTNVSLDVHGVTSLAFVSRSRGTTSASNNVVELNLKSPRLGTVQGGVTQGRSPGTPITVPNGLN